MTPSDSQLEAIRRELARQEQELAKIDELSRAYAHVQLHIGQEIESQMASIDRVLTRPTPAPLAFAVRV